MLYITALSVISTILYGTPNQPACVSTHFREEPRQLCPWGRRVNPWARLVDGIRRGGHLRARALDGVAGLTPGRASAGGRNSSGAAGISKYVRLNCAFTFLAALCISCSRRACCRMGLISDPAVSPGMDSFESSFRITNALGDSITSDTSPAFRSKTFASSGASLVRRTLFSFVADGVSLSPNSL